MLAPMASEVAPSVNVFQNKLSEVIRREILKIINTSGNLGYIENPIKRKFEEESTCPSCKSNEIKPKQVYIDSEIIKEEEESKFNTANSKNVKQDFNWKVVVRCNDCGEIFNIKENFTLEELQPFL